jgi:hypothetical protein
VEENTAADGIELNGDQLERLNNLTRRPASATTKRIWPPSTTPLRDAGETITEIAKHEPFPLVSAPIRLAAHVPQRFTVAVTTNVPGPRQRLYALGRPLVEIIP